MRIDPTPSPSLPRWRTWLGLGLFSLSWITPAAAFLVYRMDLPAGVATVLMGACVFGLPEAFLVLAALVLGKEGLAHYTGRVLALLRQPAGPVRYYSSFVVMMVTSIVPWWLYGYMPDRMPHDLGAQHQVFATADLLFAAAFVLAGPEFWGKLVRLATWEGRGEASPPSPEATP